MKPLLALTLLLFLSACEKQSSEIEPAEEKALTEEEAADAIEIADRQYRRDRLEAAFAKREAAFPFLKKIKINEFRPVEKEGYTSLLVTFTNHTDKAISHIELNYIEKDPDRETPYFNSDLSFSFYGGIEPGETKEAESDEKLYPSTEPNVERSITITRLFGSDFKPFADASMTRAEAAQLLELRKEMDQTP